MNQQNQPNKRRRKLLLPGVVLSEEISKEVTEFLAPAIDFDLDDNSSKSTNIPLFADTTDNTNTYLQLPVNMDNPNPPLDTAEADSTSRDTVCKTSERQHSGLPHQSKSDTSCNYRFQEVTPVQESDSNNENDNMKPAYQRCKSAETRGKSFDKKQMISKKGELARQHFSSSGSNNSGRQSKNSHTSNSILEDDTICDDGTASSCVENDPFIDDAHQNNFTFGLIDSSGSSYGSSFGIDSSSSILRKYQMDSSSRKYDSCPDSIISLKQFLCKHRITDILGHHSSSPPLQALKELSERYNKLSHDRKRNVSKHPPVRQEKFKKNVEGKLEDGKLCSLDENSSLFPSFDKEIYHQLEAEARCRDLKCQVCKEIRDYLNNLKDANFDVKPDTTEECILNIMYIHSSNCCVERCSFYWCEKVPKCVLEPFQQLMLMKHRVENDVRDPFLDGDDLDRFIKIHSDIQEYPDEDVDWKAVCRLSSSRNSVIVLPLHQSGSDSGLDLWMFKKVDLMDDFPDRGMEYPQVELFECLKSVQNECILQPLWAATFVKPGYFVVCSPFEYGVPLSNAVQYSPIQLELVINLMLQVIDTTEHLHQKGILFLNWSGSNVMVDQTLTRIKLIDFTSSILKKHISDDIDRVNFIGEIRCRLPPHVHPPELLASKPELSEKSDVWGLGCLLHEMVTGKYVWHEFEHEPVERLLKMICRRQPRIPSCLKELTGIFKACWEINRLDRSPLSQLKELFISVEPSKPLASPK